jgi:alpha-galactosidase/6-phospho-beta-glucosidase family protein
MLNQTLERVAGTVIKKREVNHTNNSLRSDSRTKPWQNSARWQVINAVKDWSCRIHTSILTLNQVYCVINVTNSHKCDTIIS